MSQEIRLPTHIAIVPDGNRRWSEAHGVSQLDGHEAGAETMHKVLDYLIELQIKYLTLWGFSSDNWNRSEEEVSSLFQLLAAWIEQDAPWLDRNYVHLCHIGRFDELPYYLKSAIARAVTLTQDNMGITLTLAFNYGGRADLIDAVRRLLKEGVSPEQIDESSFSKYLYTNGIPDVDLLIRTAGEFRLSNFMLWQTAYSEYYFTPTLWPDFSKKEMEKALEVYMERKRRLGGD